MARPIKKGPRLSYEQAKHAVQLEGIGSRDQYFRWWDTYRPLQLPRRPNRSYKEWTGWNDFLNNNNEFLNKVKKQFRPFKDALLYARQSGIMTGAEWADHTHPTDIPRRPDIYYLRKGFIGWKHFLGKGKHEIAHKIETAKRLTDTSILLFCYSNVNDLTEINISVHPNTDLAKAHLSRGGRRFVKAFKLESEYDWRAAVSLFGTDYGEGLWLIPNINDLIFNIDLEWVR